VNSNPDRHLLADVALYLAEAGKAVETAPNGIAIGIIKMRSWQLHRIEPVPPDFAGHAAYLVRANYEFDIGADVPAPSWAEVEFQFGDPQVTVMDATPRAVTTAVGAREYELTEKLTFVLRVQHAATARLSRIADGIAVPPVLPRIECFGLGGDSIRWRHSQDVPAGTHTGWFAMLTPPEYLELKVVGGGEYHVVTEPRLKLRPAARRDAFTVRLPASASAPLIVTGQVTGSSAGKRRPRVFVSYAQESAQHKQAVVGLCSFLDKQRVDVRYDQQDLETRRNWDAWTTTQILRSDYVIVVASPAYQAVGDGTLPPDQHRGVHSEYQRLADLLHRYREIWTRKLLPVVLPGRSADELPLTFLPGTGDYYTVESFTPEGAADLLAVLLGTKADEASNDR
jgi:hypothetical protein